ncbi:hypothetical protein E4U21_003970 [Claviceps maximensis]|nr:hypothetical protein E4U21_003970 [Claviceps maximensis]
MGDMGSLDESYTDNGWRLGALPQETGSIVITIDLNSKSEALTEALNEDSAGSECPASQFLRRIAHTSHGDGLVKLLLPLQSGYVVQSDFLERRMIDCPHVVKVKSFCAVGQRIEGHAMEKYQSMSLSSLLPFCYGAVQVQIHKDNDHYDSSRTVTASSSTAVDDELVNRISFPWLSSSPIHRKRLALVGASSLHKLQGYLLAAASLNIGIVVFDDASHWIADDAYKHLREEFVAMDLQANESIVERIVQTLREYQQSKTEDTRLIGLISMDEHLHTIVSKAAGQLNFHSSPPEAVSLAQNKFETRQLDPNVFCRLVRSRDDLEAMLSKEGPQLPYPLIVKPSKGWSSEGVWKVHDEQELREKSSLLWRESFTAWHGHDVVIETYIDGPEVDANMVLVDGEIAFFEVNDDFPSAGDGIGRDAVGARVPNFVETSNMIPSGLPPSEVESLQQKLHELALAAGFRNAVLHMEAKLRNSRCRYATDASGNDDADGLIDLQLNTSATTTTQPSDVFLLEINPRAPGWQEVEATARAYGVSYYAISLLTALGDKSRVLALSRPFRGGAQYFMQLLFVSAQKGGTYTYGDICTTVLRAHPDKPGQEQDLAAHVVHCANLMEDGEQVLDPSTGQVFGNFIAFFLVVSRRSRRECLRVGRQIELRVRDHTNHF